VIVYVYVSYIYAARRSNLSSTHSIQSRQQAQSGVIDLLSSSLLLRSAGKGVGGGETTPPLIKTNRLKSNQLV
jgi:hypothetical protein